MNAEQIENVLDLAAWVFGGLLFGLLVLGAYNGYREYRNPSIPSLSVSPLQESDVEPEPDRPSFQPLDEFHLVRTLAPQQSEEDPEEDDGESRSDTVPENRSEDIETTALPYRLLGTTTGAPAYTSAVIRHRGRRETRTLGVNEEWEEIRVLAIEDDSVLIRNLTNSNREKILLDEKNSPE